MLYAVPFPLIACFVCLELWKSLLFLFQLVFWPSLSIKFLLVVVCFVTFCLFVFFLLLFFARLGFFYDFFISTFFERFFVFFVSLFLCFFCCLFLSREGLILSKY